MKCNPIPVRENLFKEYLKELYIQTKYQKLVKDHLDQFNLTIENREKELQRTYLFEELNKIKDKNLS